MHKLPSVNQRLPSDSLLGSSIITLQVLGRGSVPAHPSTLKDYSMLLRDSTILILFILKYIMKFTNIENKNVSIKPRK